MKKSREELERIEIGQMKTSLLEFLKLYNKDIPASFPHVSAPILKRFKSEHPALFKDGDTWSVDQHRKKLIDWLFGFDLNLISSPKK